MVLDLLIVHNKAIRSGTRATQYPYGTIKSMQPPPLVSTGRSQRSFKTADPTPICSAGKGGWFVNFVSR